MAKETTIVAVERIQQCIHLIRKHKVILDADLARLYGVETGALVRAVKRNIERFPADFMFQLTKTEYENFLRCQIGTSKQARGGRRYLPYAFTEQGVAMLSSVLKSRRAVEVNIAIMRTFVKLREILGSNELLRRKIESMERKYDEQFKAVFQAIKRMMLPEPEKPKPPIGYHTEAKGQEEKAKKRKAKGRKSSRKKTNK